jgi:CHAT domain-containing protein/tetratricopeptide (TPR) repeat protein
MIEPDKPFSIAPKKVKSLSLEVPADAFLHVVVEQHGVDVVVSLTAQGQRQPLVRVDAPIGDGGEEELTAILPAAGSYRVDVTPPGDTGGRCTLHIAALRPATAEDRQRVEADRVQREGWQLYREDPRSEAALDRYRHALTLRGALGLARQQAETLVAMAQVYQQRDQPDIALAILDRAILLARAAGGAHHDRLLLGTALALAGKISRRTLGLSARAVGRYLAEATAIFESKQASKDLAASLQNLGRAYYDVGELAQALDAYDRALKLPSKASRPGFQYVMLRDRAMAFLAFHRGSDAYRDASRAVALADGDSTKAQARRAVAQTVQARALIQTGDLEDAERVLGQALAISRELSAPKLEADALQALGALLREQNRLDEARATLEQARALVAETGGEGEAIVAIELGYLDVLEGHTERGLERFELARRRFAERGDPRGEASVHARAAEALRDLGRLEEALARIERAIELVEGIRAATAREDVRLGFFAFRQEYYDIALDILARHHDAAPSAARAGKALAMHERRLARELGEHLERRAATGAEHDTADSGTADSGTDETALLKRLATAASDATAEPATIDALLVALARVRSRTPPNASLGVTGLDARDIERLRNEVLDTKTVILVFALGTLTSLRWTLDRNGLRLERIPRSRGEIESQVKALVAAWRSGSRERMNARQRLGAELAQHLLPSDLPAGTERLVIVADGALNHIPFAALPGPPDGRPLIESYEIVMQSSLRSLLALRQRNDQHPPWPRPIAVFADPVFDATDPRLAGNHDTSDGNTAGGTASADQDLERTARALGLDRFPRLAHSADEAAVITQLAGTENVIAAVGFDASRATLQSLDLQGLGLLHLATHALVDPDRPDLSSLVLSRYDLNGVRQAGAVYGFEIAGWSLSADLVVLSACDTGRGRDVRGEGVLGPSRRFIEAGATRMVVSLWPVSDRQTAALMTAFYDGLLGQGLAPAAALRQAQLAAARDPANADNNAGNNDWAGFVFQGDWRPFKVSAADSAKEH